MTPSTRPISTASFLSNTFTFDPLLAGECTSQSAQIAGGLGVLTRGTVLYGPASPAPIVTATLLTTATGAGQARCILAADIDTTGGPSVGLVYTSGKFLDTAMTFTSAGAASDCASLWDFGIYVLTVEQRSGLLVPMKGLPTVGGPLPQAFSPKQATEALKEEVTAIKSAAGAPHLPFEPAIPGEGPAWAEAAFGKTEPSALQKAEADVAEKSYELGDKQKAEQAELEAKQAKERAELEKKQAEQRQKLAAEAAKAAATATSDKSTDKPNDKPSTAKH